MSKILAIAFCGMVLAIGGCQDKNKDMSSESDKTMTAAGDDCAHCPGVQHANANGICPSCGMKVKG